MNKLSNFILNKFNIVDVLVVGALLLFALHLFQSIPSLLDMHENPYVSAAGIFKAALIVFFSSIYNSLMLIALAKIIQLIEEKEK